MIEHRTQSLLKQFNVNTEIASSEDPGTGDINIIFKEYQFTVKIPAAAQDNQPVERGFHKFLGDILKNNPDYQKAIKLKDGIAWLMKQ